MAVDGVVVQRIGLRLDARLVVGHDLMAKEVEIDPGLGASPLWATENAAVEDPRGRDVIDRERDVKGREPGIGLGH